MTRALSFCHFFAEDTVLSFAPWQVEKQKRKWLHGESDSGGVWEVREVQD